MVLRSSLNLFVLLTLNFALVVFPNPLDESLHYPDYDYTDETPGSSCDASSCPSPDCNCFGSLPRDIPVKDLPQFVMLTFDDAISVANFGSYRRIAVKKHRNGQPIQLTFFVCHDYNDYTLTNELYRKGHEIAVHSITHEANTDLWRNSTEDKWKKEMQGMRLMLKTFAGIPEGEVVGHRAPFLQTAGDNTFRAISKLNFTYDSSMPTRNYVDPPLWPYTLDYGYAQDCQIQPCPKDQYKGMWMIPMTQFLRTSKEGDFFCSMVDACTPYPITAQDTRDYLMKNFLRHYKTNKAPFPVFLHEAWLKDKARLQGYLQFLDELLQMEDVFLVTVRSVIEYMKHPVPFFKYEHRKTPRPLMECPKTEVCNYSKPTRIMRSCVSCSPYYPWLGTPLGKKPPVGIV